MSIFDINKITFNAETNCYPDGCLANKYPDNDSKWKFLNASIYFGISNNIRNMYQTTLEKIKYTDDQLELSKLFLENANLIDLDYSCQIFQMLYNGHVGGDISEEDFIFDISKKILRISISIHNHYYFMIMAKLICLNYIHICDCGCLPSQFKYIGPI